MSAQASPWAFSDESLSRVVSAFSRLFPKSTRGGGGWGGLGGVGGGWGGVGGGGWGLGGGGWGGRVRFFFCHPPSRPPLGSRFRV